MVSTINHPPAVPVDPIDTVIVGRNPRLRRMATNAPTGTDDVINQKQVVLLIRSMSEEILLTEKEPVILGRSNPQQGYYPDVDLTRYGGRSKGISRAHARLHLQDDHLYVTDLCSGNGTYIRGERLVPDKPHLLQRGDEIFLGCLPVRVDFE